ncbi:MAG: hypothetical protein OT477_14855 [Chloroflexi bacterium]|nr:hypothetical protein [Chloroflexota bacterium]
MSTLAQVVELCKRQLNSSPSAIWPEASIEGWVREAMDEFSNYDPLRDTATATAESDGQTVFEMAAGTLFVDWVEIGTTQLVQEQRYSAQWGDGGLYYCVHPRNAAGEVNLELSAAAAEFVSDGTTLVLTVRKMHNSDAADDDELTIHPRHNHILQKGVKARALRQRESDRYQQLGDDSRKVLADAAERAQVEWREALESVAPFSFASSWDVP